MKKILIFFCLISAFAYGQTPQPKSIFPNGAEVVPVPLTAYQVLRLADTSFLSTKLNSLTLAQLQSRLGNYYLASNPNGYITASSAVTSVIGTSNQIIVSASTGNVTFSLPQNISASSIPTFLGIFATANATATTGGIVHIQNQAINAAGNNTELRLEPSSAPSIRYAAVRGTNDGSNNISLSFLTGVGASITEKLILASGGDLYPANDNANNFGLPSKRYANGYFTNIQLGITGLLKGNGTSGNIGAAVAGTDYVLPSALSSYYLASNPNGYTSNTGTVTNVVATNSIGVNFSVSNPTTTPNISLTLTSAAVGLGNVENKNSATIRGELTSGNVTTALGYTPYNSTNPAGYISSFTETDPTVPSNVKAITGTNISNWNSAYSWGNHASAGYLNTDGSYQAVSGLKLFQGGLSIDNNIYFNGTASDAVGTGLGWQWNNAPTGINPSAGWRPVLGNGNSILWYSYTGFNPSTYTPQFRFLASGVIQYERDITGSSDFTGNPNAVVPKSYIDNKTSGVGTTTVIEGIAPTVSYTVTASMWGSGNILTIVVSAANATGAGITVYLPQRNDVQGKIINVKRSDGSSKTFTVNGSDNNIDESINITIPMKWGNAQILAGSNQYYTL